MKGAVRVLCLVAFAAMTVFDQGLECRAVDNSGKVIWVSDGYVDDALKPQTPIPFAVDVRDDVAANVKNYRVTVNHYSIDRPSI